MIGVRAGVGADAVRFDARHVLFVEGGGDDAIDPTVLRALLGSRLRIEPLGRSLSVTSVAAALHPSHPDYYFLIDRDHHDETFVEQSWGNFPDEGSRNLLVWRKREIENYFLDPGYLAHSKYFVESVDRLREFIVNRAQHRLYLDVANSVIVSLREAIKMNRFQTFTDPQALSTRDIAIRALNELGLSDQYPNLSDQELSSERIETAFDDTLRTMTGETDGVRDKLRLGAGKWIDMMRGKKLFAEIVASNLFRVAGRDGNLISGAQVRNEVARDLLQREEVTQRADFEQLKGIMMQRIGAG